PSLRPRAPRRTRRTCSRRPPGASIPRARPPLRGSPESAATSRARSTYPGTLKDAGRPKSEVGVTALRRPATRAYRGFMSVAPLSRTASSPHRGSIEVATLVALYAIYEVVRGQGNATVAVAREHTHWVVDIERSLHVFGERAVQQGVDTLPA